MGVFLSGGHYLLMFPQRVNLVIADALRYKDLAYMDVGEMMILV